MFQVEISYDLDKNNIQPILQTFNLHYLNFEEYTSFIIIWPNLSSLREMTLSLCAWSTPVNLIISIADEKRLIKITKRQRIAI